MPPTIRATFDNNGNLTAIETYQGPRGWVQLLAEPIQRADVPDLVAALSPTPTSTVTPPISPAPPDTAAALWSAIDAYGCDAASHGALGRDATTRAALHRAITAHVEAEFARRLACAPGVEEAIDDYEARVTSLVTSMTGRAADDATAVDVARDHLRAAIAADRARAVGFDQNATPPGAGGGAA